MRWPLCAPSNVAWHWFCIVVLRFVLIAACAPARGLLRLGGLKVRRGYVLYNLLENALRGTLRLAEAARGLCASES